MENNENNIQNQVNEVEKEIKQEAINGGNGKSKKSGVPKIIVVLIIAVIIFVIGIGVGCGIWLIKKENNGTNSTEIQSGAINNTEEVCVRVEHKMRGIENNNDGMYCIDVYGYDKDEKEIWKYTTVEGVAMQYLNVEYLGEKNNKVYLNEEGTIVALDKNTGKVVWKNSEYKGYSSMVDNEEFDNFDKDGNLYLVSMHNGPDLFIIDSNGKTKKKFYRGELNKSLGILNGMKIDSSKDELILRYSLSYGVSEYENTLTMKLSDYTYSVEKKDVGNYKYDENGLVIMEDYSGISSFWGKWENEQELTEIIIGQQDIFLLDHYTKASEVLGNCVIKGNKIELIAKNGQKWNGELMGQKDKEEFVLKIKVNGKDVILERTDSSGELIKKDDI